MQQQGDRIEDKKQRYEVLHQQIVANVIATTFYDIDSLVYLLGSGMVSVTHNDYGDVNKELVKPFQDRFMCCLTMLAA